MLPHPCPGVTVQRPLLGVHPASLPALAVLTCCTLTKVLYQAQALSLHFTFGKFHWTVHQHSKLKLSKKKCQGHMHNCFSSWFSRFPDTTFWISDFILLSYQQTIPPQSLFLCLHVFVYVAPSIWIVFLSLFPWLGITRFLKIWLKDHLFCGTLQKD